MTAPRDEQVFAHFHDVWIDRDNIEHYRALMQERLTINRCADCGTWIYPHRPLCPACLGWQVAPVEVSGRGTLYMWTVIHQSRDPDTPMVEPVVAAAIELVEQPGLRYLSNIIGCGRSSLRHDMPVQLFWTDVAGRRWPAFMPAGDGGY